MWHPFRVRQQCKRALASLQEALEIAKKYSAMVDQLLTQNTELRADNEALRQQFTITLSVHGQPPAVDLAALESITEVVQ
jgi:transcription elongation factor GreA-like protein